jgi:prolipoprotein diacylglyceryltransferase
LHILGSARALVYRPDESRRGATMMNQYFLIWTAAGATGFLAGTLVLRHRGLASLRGLLVLAAGWCGLLVGAKWQFRLESLPVGEALLVSPADLLTPGMRLPLGLLTGALFAALHCAIMRFPWLDAGDALAVAASVVIPIGRIACLLNGCCMGTVCPAWAAAFCLRFPPGSETYNAQLRAEVITLAAPVSLPAHPLPLYFAAASILTLIVLLWLLRRGAPAGALLAAFCLLRPLAKLALEPLRASTPSGPSGLMLAIPLGVLVTTSVVLLLRFAGVPLRTRRVV